MPGPLIVRWIGEEQIARLANTGRVAFYSIVSAMEGERVRIWFEREARWLEAIVEKVLVRPKYREVAGLAEYSGFETADKWIEYETKRHKGSLPPYLILLRLAGTR